MSAVTSVSKSWSREGSMRHSKVERIPPHAMNGSEKTVAGSHRKQLHPKSLDSQSVEDEMYGQSESDDDMMPTPFVYKSRLASATERCRWCKQHNTEPELSLVAQDKTTRSFCSEGCQDNFKDDVLRSKVCEWCQKKYPRGSSLIVMEPSIQSVPIQFCTSSCVNKYKMEVFCEEVKAQLRRIKDENIDVQSAAYEKSQKREHKILITPELWNEGEQALVFVSNCDRENKCNTSRISDENRVQKASCGDRTSQIDRKRKGQSMETVISKISKRSSVSSTGEIAEGIPMGRQATPINLSLNRPSNHNSLLTSRDNHSHVQERGQPTAMTSGLIPVPIVLPIPIPVPIPLGLNTGLMRQNNIHPPHMTYTPPMRLSAIDSTTTVWQAASTQQHQDSRHNVNIAQNSINRYPHRPAYSKTCPSLTYDEPE